jgi:AcrR family transcriptional regulator
MITPPSEIAELRKPTLKERQRQLREDAILDAAEDLLLNRGLGAMTLEDLSVEVGISKPTLYQHFRSKDEVIAGIMTRGLRAAKRQLREFAAVMPPAKALKTLIEVFVEKRAEKNCGPVTDLCIALCQLAQGPIREAEREFNDEIERLVTLGQEDGSIRAGVPALFVSQTMISISKDVSYHDMLNDGRTDIPTMKKALIEMLLGPQ